MPLVYWLLLAAMIAGGVLRADDSTPSAGNPSAAGAAPIPGWAVSTSPATFVVELDDPNKPAPLIAVDLDLPDPRWAGMPIRVFTDAGVAVGSDLLWSAPGEPATLLFDAAPKANRYDIYFGSNWPAVHLQNLKNGVLLESRAGDGRQYDHVPDFLKSWDASPAINGRALLDSVFEGGNRFGPEGNLFLHFHGWFKAAAAGHYQFALIANDAVFLQIDGKDVAAWPGAHDFRLGLGGQYQGGTDLTAGLHVLDYYNSYIAVRDHPVLCCLAVKGGPFANFTMLTPNSPFFLPTARAHVVDYSLQSATTGPSAAPARAIAWTQQSQSVIAPDVPNIGFIKYQLTSYPKPLGTVTWTFDDGTTAQGPSVAHLFPRPGMRHVQMVEKSGNNVMAAAEQIINVHPNWMQLSTFEPQLIPADGQDISARDPAALNVSDLAGCIAVFGVFKNADALLKLGPALCAHAKDFSDADLPYLRDAALFLAETDRAHPAQVVQILSALTARAGNNPAIANTLRLFQASVLLTNTDHTADIKALLDAIDPKTLSGSDPRLLGLVRAHLALAAGDVDSARKQFEAMTGKPSGFDARSSIRATADISRARVFIGRGDFESAEDALNGVAWRSPIDTLSPEWALTRLQVYQGEGLIIPAYLWAKRLLPFITEDGRAELLFRLADLAQSQGDTDLQKKVLTELLQKHPYSEEAAKAKQRWPHLVSEK